MVMAKRSGIIEPIVPYQYISLEQNTFLATKAPAIALNFSVTQNILLRNNLFLGQLATGVSFLYTSTYTYQGTLPGAFDDISNFIFRNRIEAGSAGNRWQASGSPCRSFPGKGAVIWQNAAPCQSPFPETGSFWDGYFQDAPRNTCPYITSATTSPPDLTTASSDSAYTEILTTESNEPIASVISNDDTGSSPAKTVAAYQTLPVLAVIYSILIPFYMSYR